MYRYTFHTWLRLGGVFVIGYGNCGYALDTRPLHDLSAHQEDIKKCETVSGIPPLRLLVVVD